MQEDKKPDQEEEAAAAISAEEMNLLDESLENSTSADEINLKRSSLDNRDQDGELLNEKSFEDDITGEDLDIPGADDDNPDEMIGEEDEENNGYSEADTA